MKPSLAIIGDDLTGALDAAAPFAARGARVSVALDPGAVGSALAEAPDVVAVSTNSREIAAAAAEAAVRETMEQLPAGTAIFKKIDSRMKGNIEAELAAIPARGMLVAPAIPEFGRVVLNGRIMGFGVDEHIDIRARLGAQAGTATIPDTEDTAAMRLAVAQSGADLLVGARGLADALAARQFPREPRLIRDLPGPEVLFVVGSADPITLAQVDALRRGGYGAAYTVLSAEAGAHGLAAARDLARSAAAQVAGHRGTVLLTGGATAAAVMEALSIRVLHLDGECLPGLPVARTRGLTIVTKSGGFGAVDTLLEVSRMIRSSHHEAAD